MRISANLSALLSYNAARANRTNLSKAVGRLSTGLRIGAAADDAAGLAISEKMRAQTRGLDQASSNAQDGISMIQTAEGALSETHAILQRMRELAVQAANDTLTSEDREYIQLEVGQLRDEIDRIAATTQFNKKKLLDGSASALWSSDKLSTEAIVRGGLTSTDQFGQKVSAEGNYRIEISAEPGEAQVQKSNVMRVADTVTVTTSEMTSGPTTEIVRVPTTEIQRVPIYDTEEEAYTIRLGTSGGSPTVTDSLGCESGAEALAGETEPDEEFELPGTGWYSEYDAANDVRTLVIDDATGGTYKIDGSGAGFSSRHRIRVAAGSDVKIILSDVRLEAPYKYQANEDYALLFDIEAGAAVDLYLEGLNNFTSRCNGYPGISLPDGASLTITSAKGDYETDGRLIAVGGVTAAGIGGEGWGGRDPRPTSGKAGSITINGGTIQATGGKELSNAPGGAGIGGGNTEGQDGGGKITINGGHVTAAGGPGSAGIGSGYDADVPHNAAGYDETEITITGGTIIATSPDATGVLIDGAAIGGGGSTDGGVIRIKPGLSITTTVGTTGGSHPAEAIGHGEYDGIMPTIPGYVLDATLAPPPARGPIAEPVSVRREIVGYEEKEVVTGWEEKEVVTGSEPREVLVHETREVRRTLAEIGAFYDANGVFALRGPQALTIRQGDGRSASVTLCAGDTLYDAAEKIGDAIAHGLGQGARVSDIGKFCTVSDGTAGTSESVRAARETGGPVEYRRDDAGALILDEKGDPILARPAEYLGYSFTYKRDADGGLLLDEAGAPIPNETLRVEEIYATLLIRSAMPGAAGELNFSGGEELLKALGLNTIQEARESEFTATVYDAHSGMLVGPREVTGNVLHGAVGGVDVRFDPLADTEVIWNEEAKRLDLRSAGGTYTTTVHLADSTTILQTGANEGEDFALSFGDASASALGLDGVLMISRETASRSVTVVDGALSRVSRMRAALGAYQNRLEHTVTNLTAASANTTASESRIRDADMAREMMEFTKLNILSQSGNSMMAQANQLPQAMLSLLR